MSVKIKRNGQTTISPQMALLHLRWQQIRQELLEQASQGASGDIPPDSSSTDKKTYALA